MRFEKVPGKKSNHHVKIYTLSTCGWCKKTKDLLKSLDIRYEYLDVDKLVGEEKNDAVEELKKYNPRCSFPTMVVDEGKHVIIGYNDDQIREVLR